MFFVFCANTLRVEMKWTTALNRQCRDLSIVKKMSSKLVLLAEIWIFEISG